MNGETVLTRRPVAPPRRSSPTTPRTPASAPQVDPRRILGNQAIARHAAAAAGSGDVQWSPAVLQGSRGDAARIPIRAGGPGGQQRRLQVNSNLTGVLYRKCACEDRATVGGECEDCEQKPATLQRHPAGRGPVEAAPDTVDDTRDLSAGRGPNHTARGVGGQLVVTEPGDACEQEAERVTDQVVTGSAAVSVGSASASVQRSGTGSPQGWMRRRPAPNRLSPAPARRSKPDPHGHGAALRLRLLPGAAARRSRGRAIGPDVDAHAYTAGNAIVFGAGHFASATHEGRHLPAHELTHVVQQTRRGAMLQPKSPLEDSCDECRSYGMQRKLVVGTSDDPYEIEADRVAEAVLAAKPVRAPPTLRISRVSTRAAAEPEVAAPASVEATLAGSGHALEPVLRDEMERRFGYDFNRVRIHVGARAEQSARDVNALAYTVGDDIVSGAGRYSPATPDGRRLLTHELTHVVQQSARAPLAVAPASERAAVSDSARGAETSRRVLRNPDRDEPKPNRHRRWSSIFLNR